MTSDNNNRGPATQGKRTRAAGRSGKGGIPPIMWVAVIVIVIGAVFLFRQGDDEVPTGIGERRTVITSEASYQSYDEDDPRSGDVDIADAEKTLVPEKPEGGAAESASKPTASKPATTIKEPARAASSTTTTSSLPKPDPKPEPIRPVANGPYVVQVGSFGSSENADVEAARLKKAGWDALVKVGNTSDGTIIYRVRIGYFRSRADADKFIRENRKLVGGAIAAHR